MESVYCAVRTGSFNIIHVNVSLQFQYERSKMLLRFRRLQIRFFLQRSARVNYFRGFSMPFLVNPGGYGRLHT